MTDMSADHARISPSSLARIVKCPGSLALCASDPYVVENDDGSADEGTRAHEIAANRLNGNPDDSCDPDMLKFVMIYVAYIRSLLTRDARLIIEQKVPVVYLHPTDCFGTPDAVVITGNELYVVDFKYGRKWVTSYEQLIAYAAGAIIHYNITVETIHLTYIQPRANHPDGPIRTLTLTPIELKQRADYIKSRIDLALTPNAPLHSGMHCYRCPRQYDCVANTEAAVNIIEMVGDITQTVDSSLSALENEYEVLESAEKMLAERMINVREVIQHRMQNGERGSKYQYAYNYGNRTFNADEKTMIVECSLEGLDYHKQVGKSPAELEKEGLPPETLKRLTKQSIYPKLKKINFDHARKVFKHD